MPPGDPIPPVFPPKNHQNGVQNGLFWRKTLISRQNPRYLQRKGTAFQRFRHEIKPFRHRLQRFRHRAKPFRHRLQSFHHRAKPFCHRLQPFRHKAKRFFHRLQPFFHRLQRFFHPPFSSKMGENDEKIVRIGLSGGLRGEPTATGSEPRSSSNFSKTRARLIKKKTADDFRHPPLCSPLSAAKFSWRSLLRRVR